MKTNKIIVKDETINKVSSILSVKMDDIELKKEFYGITSEEINEIRNLIKFLDDSYVGKHKNFFQIEIKGSNPF